MAPLIRGAILLKVWGMQNTTRFDKVNNWLLFGVIIWILFSNTEQSGQQAAPLTPTPYPYNEIPLPNPSPNPSLPINPTPNAPPLNPPSSPTRPTPNTNAKVDKVMETALSWVGREFNPGVSAQCAFFVRHVFKQAGHPLPVSNKSIDPRNSQSAGMAHSLCGADVGERVINLEGLKPGCIAAFERTYGSWGPGYITHVGVYGGGWRSKTGKTIPPGNMIDRNTRGGPVRIKDIKDYGDKFVGGFCPHILFKGEG